MDPQDAFHRIYTGFDRLTPEDDPEQCSVCSNAATVNQYARDIVAYYENDDDSAEVCAYACEDCSMDVNIELWLCMAQSLLPDNTGESDNVFNGCKFGIHQPFIDGFEHGPCYNCNAGATTKVRSYLYPHQMEQVSCDACRFIVGRRIVDELREQSQQHGIQPLLDFMHGLTVSDSDNDDDE